MPTFDCQATQLPNASIAECLNCQVLGKSSWLFSSEQYGADTDKNFMFDFLHRQLRRHPNGDWEYCDPASNEVSVLWSFQRMTQPESTPANAIPVRSGVGSGGLERPEFLKTVAELADPMQSEAVKRWLLGDLRAPK
jgi:hypothetical protein